MTTVAFAILNVKRICQPQPYKIIHMLSFVVAEKKRERNIVASNGEKIERMHSHRVIPSGIFL